MASPNRCIAMVWSLRESDGSVTKDEPPDETLERRRPAERSNE
jgi:hypothetical protein